ncbi:MAG: thioredoxin-like domain-containing protein [Rhodospirillales bacterium]|jgi:thiol-disulfide isomerase/thioredoxin/sugar lactone lactonase YvrE|nr:thioredoxin-like domain-containing protein [Rhodospirillales bacterium]
MYGLARAPELDRPGLTWFNVQTPFRLVDLRGRLVILDFWTFCCINCLHVVPTLRRLEERFADELVVIGVHSPKFTAEQDPDNLRHAIARCGIRHPVIQDRDMILWEAYCVKAWPTLVFVGPDGRIFGDMTGEPDSDRLLSGVGAMLGGWREQGLIAPAPLPLRPVEETGGALRFPGKIKPLRQADGSRHWAIADSGHHQIVLFDDDGAELRRFGSGLPGFMDCEAETSRFNSPQGVICREDAIFVADTGNHAIRRIDLATGRTTTLAGTGRRGCALKKGSTPAAEVELASVWDLELAGDRLFFANSGTHQLGELDLLTFTVRPLAGSSAEDIEDGPALEARLAQPSGLACDGDAGMLYFTDSETSAVRRLSLNGTPAVETLVGAGLFEFGDANGPFEQARFQHPLGLTWQDGRVIVADSYNGRLRVLDLDHREVLDVDERGFNCADDTPLPAGEPAGVVAAGPGRLLMTDTNNHRVLEVLTDERVLRTWAR